jgi:hypothetical protein
MTATARPLLNENRESHASIEPRTSRLWQTVSPSAACGRTVWRIDSPARPMPHSDTGESVTPQLNLPSRDGLVVNAILVDYEPAGYTRGHSPAPGRRVGVRDRRQHDLRTRRPRTGRAEAGESFYKQPGRCTPCRATPQELPVSLIAFFVLADGQCATGYQRPARGRRAPAGEARSFTRVSSGTSNVVPATAAVVEAAVSTCTPAPRRRGRVRVRPPRGHDRAL